MVFNQKNKSGFTLLELLMVLFLSILILSLVGLYFSNFLASAKFQTLVRDLSTTLKQARSLSKIHEGRQVVTFNLDAREYGLEGRPFKKIPPQCEVKIIDPVAGEISGGTYQLIFESDWGGESPTFILSNKKRIVTVQLDPLVGSLITR
jgi:type II secretory pathway pseudopilin PulG